MVGAVQAWYLAGNEIATHTYTHPGFPNETEIVTCRDWLVETVGVPLETVTGFRYCAVLA